MLTATRRYKNSRCKTKSNRLKEGTDEENLAAAPSVRLSSASHIWHSFFSRAAFLTSLSKKRLPIGSAQRK